MMAKPAPIPFFVLHGHEGNISALHFNEETSDLLENKPTLLSGSELGEIFIWNLQSFRTLYRLQSPEKTTVLFLGYYKSTLLCQNKAGAFNFWNFCEKAWVVTKTFMSKSVGFCSSHFWLTNDRAYVNLYDQDEHKLQAYDVEESEERETLTLKKAAGLCMCIKIVKIGESWFVLAGYETGDIGLFECKQNFEKSSMNFHKEVVTCLDFDPVHKMRGISGSPDETVSVWKIDEDLKFENITQVKLPNPGVNAVKIRQDGKIVLTAGQDHSIRVFSWKTLKPLAILNFHEQSVQCLSYSMAPIDKKNSVFASGSKDKNIALWTIY